MHDRCARAEELVDALKTKPSERMQEHLASCESCRQELDWLREGFVMMAGAEQAAPPIALRQIEAAVLSELPTPFLRRVVLALAAPLCVFGAILGLSWALGGHALHSPVRAALFGLIPTALCLFPRDRRVLVGAGLLTVLAVFSSVDQGIVLPLRGPLCAVILGGAGIVAAGLPLLAFGRTLLSGAAMGAAVFAGGMSVQTGLCDISDLAHLSLIHLGPFLLGTALFSLLPRRAAT